VRGEMSAVNELHVVNGGYHSLAVTKTQLKTSAETEEDVDQRMLMTIQKVCRRVSPTPADSGGCNS
jgi:hypothetical protein